MSPSGDPPKLNDCGCCEVAPALDPPRNQPGLSALSYRLGTHATFLRDMLARIHSQDILSGANEGVRPLAALTTRSTDDPGIALLDAWATVCDVLTFYMERIANEGYLRSATERRSVLELARAIGYELSPGVAASTFLAFTVDSAPGAPGQAIVAQGTRVQSVPFPGKLPQTFETIEDIVARAESNVIRPRLTRPQEISTDMSTIVFKGTSTNLRSGDRLLIVKKTDKKFRRVVGVETDTALNQTRVNLEGPQVVVNAVVPTFTAGSFSAGPVPFNNDNVEVLVSQRSWRKGDLEAFAFLQGWNPGDLYRNMSARPPSGPDQTEPDTGVFAFRVRAFLFGHNAPDFRALPEDMKKGKSEWDPSLSGPQGLALDAVYSQILKGSWTVVTRVPDLTEPATVKSTAEVAVANFTMGATVTQLELNTDKGILPTSMTDVRQTVVYAQSEKLQLADLRIEDPVQDQTINLDRSYREIDPGQLVIVTGQAIEDGLPKTEVATIADVNVADNLTTITLVANLAFKYKRDTVAINANVARATHGETVREVLGGGDASQINQKFVLKKPPLTYVSAPTPSGAVSTLALRVNGVLWREQPSLYGLGTRDESYTVRLDDGGRTTVIFGDGKTGARLPSGQENIVAVYRSGIGPDGEVAGGSLTLLQTRPLGIRSVTNPLAATGSAAPEDLDHARLNAPLKVTTLDRIVSLQDYEDFARAFAGIGKAQAIPLWSGESRLVHLTVAAAIGGAVDPNSSLYRSLVQAIDSVRDPVQQVRVASYQPLLFNLTASVLINSRYAAGDVLAAVEATLKAAFSFGNRAFAQAATAAEAVTVIQAVLGVIASDLTQLYFVTDASGPQQKEPLAFLPAAAARWQNGDIQAAQLLLLNPAGITLTEMKP